MPADPKRDAELLRRSKAGETSEQIAAATSLSRYYVVGRLNALALMGEPRPCDTAGEAAHLEGRLGLRE